MKRSKTIKLLIAGAFAVALAVGATPALAQKKKGGGVIRLEETVIEGRVLKPNAFFVSTRTALVYEVMEIKESFLGEIGKVVDGGSF